jgi:hypothetical protein
VISAVTSAVSVVPSVVSSLTAAVPVLGNVVSAVTSVAPVLPVGTSTVVATSTRAATCLCPTVTSVASGIGLGL